MPHFPDDSEFASFAIEVSHHVRAEDHGRAARSTPENVTVIIPVPAAQKLVDAKTDDQKQAAVLEARIFLNGQPYSLWMHEGAPPRSGRTATPPITKKQPDRGRRGTCGKRGRGARQRCLAEPAEETPTPMRILTPKRWRSCSATIRTRSIA